MLPKPNWACYLTKRGVTNHLMSRGLENEPPAKGECLFINSAECGLTTIEYTDERGTYGDRLYLMKTYPKQEIARAEPSRTI